MVLPKSRNRGIGGALLTRLEESCRDAGIRHVRLELRANNATALKFYEAMGYRAVSRVARYYDRRESAIVMAKALG